MASRISGLRAQRVGGGGGARGFSLILLGRLKGFAGNLRRFSTANAEPLNFKACEVHKARHGA